MRYSFPILLIFLFLLSACRPSARFSASKENDHDATDSAQDFTQKSSILDDFIKQWLNTPYKYGGMSRSGVDCSGFSSIVLLEVFGVRIPRMAEEQYKNGTKIRDNWRTPGDLVFFKNIRGHGIDHVGIFLGQNRFAHASESSGVVISDLEEDHYRKRYVGACRYRK